MNPLVLSLLKGAIPYAIGAAIGFSLAWGIQDLRLTAEKQKFTAYEQDQTRKFQEHQDAATKQREKSAMDYESAQKALTDSFEAAAAYRRCVAAGKCAARVRVVTACAAGNGLSASPGPDASSTDAVPPATGDAAINDCSMTTLQLNSLQADIEAQPNYTKE